MDVGDLLILYKEEVIGLLTQQFIKLKPVSNADIILVHDTNKVHMIIYRKEDSNDNILLYFNLLLLKKKIILSLHDTWKKNYITIFLKESSNLLRQAYRISEFLEKP